MVSCSSSASRSPSRRSLGICSATRGHRLRAGGRFSAITSTASRRSTSLFCRRSHSKFCIVLSLCATDDDFGCRFAWRRTHPRSGSRAKSPRRSRGTARRDISFGIETPRMVQPSCSGSVQWAFGTIRSHPDRPGKMLTERLIGSIRRECLDHMIVLGEAHLRRILRGYAAYYNVSRTHQSLNKDQSLWRHIVPTNNAISSGGLGGIQSLIRPLHKVGDFARNVSERCNSNTDGDPFAVWQPG